MQTRVIQIDAEQELVANAAGRGTSPRWAARLASAVRALRGGKIVGFPTETVYGVGAVATNARAVQRLRELKRRPRAAFTVHIASPEEAWRYVKDVPPRAAALMEKAWPGPLTILLPTGGRFVGAGLRGKALFKRICRGGVVGLRCPSDPVARLLLERVSKPVVATSANLAGRAAPRTAGQVLDQLGGRIELLVDAGGTRYGRASTIVAFDGEDCKIVRPGVYDARTIEQMTRRTILFVCLGNTCRSPMAAALARKMLAERFGCEVGELERRGRQVLSAGTSAADDAPATREAVAAAARFGAMVEKHRARRLSNDLINSADLVLCMTQRQVNEVVDRVPSSAGKTFLLDGEGDIPDPIGSDTERYASIAGRIERSLKERMKENLL